MVLSENVGHIAAVGRFTACCARGWCFVSVSGSGVAGRGKVPTGAKTGTKTDQALRCDSTSAAALVLSHLAFKQVVGFVAFHVALLCAIWGSSASTFRISACAPLTQAVHSYGRRAGLT